MEVSNRIKKGCYVLLNKQHDIVEIIEHKRGIIEQRDVKKIWKGYSDLEIEEILKCLVDANMIFKTSNGDIRAFFCPYYIRDSMPPYINDYYVDKGMNDSYTIKCNFIIEPFFREFIFNSKDFSTVEDYWKWGVFLSLNNEWVIVVANTQTDTITIFFDKEKSILLNIIKGKIENK